MKTKQTTISGYVNRWNEHITTMDRLRWSLTTAQADELEGLQEALRSLVAEASKNLAKAREGQ